jgi:hypothetical protein
VFSPEVSRFHVHAVPTPGVRVVPSAYVPEVPSKYSVFNAEDIEAELFPEFGACRVPT